MSPEAARLDGPISACDLFYRLDASDIIIETGGTWVEFAAADAGGPAISPASVIGTSIYDHVSGHFTRRFLRAFIADTRSSGIQSRQIYRCDSPDEKRLIEMRCEREAGSVVRLTHRLEEIADLPFALRLSTAVRARRTTAARCSMCNRIQREKKHEWLEPEIAVHRGESLQVVHTVCPDCRNRVAVKRLSLKARR